MKKFIVAALTFAISVSAHAWTHGAGTPPAVICTFTTGNCLGTGGGSSLFTPATCNGSTDDAGAFISFHNWAVGTWQASHSGQIQLLWPTAGTCVISSNTVTCATNSNAQCPFINIKNLLVSGNTGTFKAPVGNIISIGGEGLFPDNLHDARTLNANKGDSCVSLITPAQASIFTVGGPVLISGYDLQSIFGANFGFPPNWQFFDFSHVASIDTVHQCDGTTSGASIHLATSLTSQYLSAWPNYVAGDAGDIDMGGPATIYALSPSWDAIVEFDNLTFSFTGIDIQAQNDTVIFNGISSTSTCPIPSVTRLWKLLNSNVVACGSLEVDKEVDTIVTANSNISELFFQSSSVHTWQDTGSTIAQLQGSPLATTANGTNFTSIMKPGAVGFGRTNSFSCTNCVVASLQNGGVTDSGFGAHGVQTSYTMSSGVIKAALGTTYSSTVSNGGAIQLVVASSAGWTTGQWVDVVNGSGTNPWQITVDDPTHITLQGSAWTATDSGEVCGCAIRWGAPGTNIMLASTAGVEAIGQITGVTHDSTFAFFATTFSGGFPSDITTIQSHPAPIFNCPGCTGSDPQIASLAQAPANAPLYSYQTYNYPGSNGTAQQNPFSIWGTISNFEINVTAPSAAASTFHAAQSDNWRVYSGGSLATLVLTSNSHVSGDRKVNSAGSITCNGSPGVCDAADSLGSLGNTWFPGVPFSGPAYSGTPGSAATTFTIQTSQGVVNP